MERATEMKNQSYSVEVVIESALPLNELIPKLLDDLSYFQVRGFSLSRVADMSGLADLIQNIGKEKAEPEEPWKG